jgi:lysine biosynthesis protein LysW
MDKGNARTNSITAFCRACHTRIRFDKRPELFAIVACPECEREFEVVGVSPVKLDWLQSSADDTTWSDQDRYYHDLFDEWGGKGHQFFSRY